MNTTTSSTSAPRPRLTRLVRVFETLLTLCLWLMYAGAGALLLMTIYSASAAKLPAGLSQEVEVAINPRGFALQSPTGEPFGLEVRTINAKVAFTSAQRALWLINPSFAIVGLMIASAFTHHLRQVVRSLYDESPFVAANTRRIRLLGWIMLIATIWQSVSAFVLTGVVESTTPATNLVHTLHFDFKPYLVVLAIFVFAEVFRIGVELKTEQELTV